MSSARSTARSMLGGLFVVGLAFWLVVGCAGPQQEEGHSEEEHNIYFGWLLGTSDIVAVAFDVGAPDEQGTRDVRAYACNGLGGADTLAVWFRGPVNEQTVNQEGGQESLTSSAGQETLVIRKLADHQVSGSFTGADGRTFHYAAFPASDGAGIYDVTLDEDLRYSGTSTDGSTLEAQADGGFVRGAITTAEDKEIEFAIQTLALMPAEQLSEEGLPTGYTQFADVNLVPGEYVAVISPGGSHWFGRDGDVRRGSPGTNIITLDAE